MKACAVLETTITQFQCFSIMLSTKILEYYKQVPFLKNASLSSLRDIQYYDKCPLQRFRLPPTTTTTATPKPSLFSWQEFHLQIPFHNTGLSNWLTKGSPNTIAKRENLSIIVNVMRMMHSMILAPHDGTYVPIHRIVDVGCPNLREKDHKCVGEVMSGDDG